MPKNQRIILPKRKGNIIRFFVVPYGACELQLERLLILAFNGQRFVPYGVRVLQQPTQAGINEMLGFVPYGVRVLQQHPKMC
jgi:hypothetical protein